MKLSLCCISQTLSDNGHNFQAMTFAQFRKYSFDSGIKILSERILHNFKNTLKTIRFCQLNGIYGYRISSSLAPLLTHSSLKLNIRDLPNFAEIKQVCEQIKQLLKEKYLRISAHPGEYITLSSLNKESVQNSIFDLLQHAEIFDLLGLSESYENPLNIHVRQDGDPVEISKRVLDRYDALPNSVKSRLVLENNDNPNGVWSVRNLVEYFYNSRGIPITYDCLHHLLLPGQLTAQQAFNLAYNTWPTMPIFHYSESSDFSRKHADMPIKLPESFGKDVVWDVELKSKCKAIFALQKMLLTGGKN
jgi:UV DNA damage endonuclease